MAVQIYLLWSLVAVSWLYAVCRANILPSEDYLLFTALIIMLCFVVSSAGFFCWLVFSRFIPRMKRLELRVSLLHQSPFWRQLNSRSELARQVCKVGLNHYHPLHPVEWLRYTSKSSSSQPKPIVYLGPNDKRPKKYRQRQVHKRRNLITSDTINGSKNGNSNSKKYAVLTTGIPGRITLARSIGSSTAVDLGIVELPGFLTAQECDALVQEFDYNYGINKLHPQTDSYRAGKLNPDAATYKMCYLTDSPPLATVSSAMKNKKKVGKTPELDKLHKMVEPFTNTKYTGKFKRYLATESSQLGTIIHNDNSPYTLLIYLDTVLPDAGGYTEFVNLGLRFQPVKGNAIWFRNVHLDHLGAGSLGNLDERIRHCGGPLFKGKKTIIQFQDHFFGAQNV